MALLPLLHKLLHLVSLDFCATGSNMRLLAATTDWKRSVVILSGIKVIHHLILLQLMLIHLWVKHLVHFGGLLRLKLLLDLLAVLEVLGCRQLGVFWLVLLNEPELALKDFAWVLLMHLVLISWHFDGRSQLF